MSRYLFVPGEIVVPRLKLRDDLATRTWESTVKFKNGRWTSTELALPR